MASKKIITVSAPGKIHFLGEHVVVHGKPALIAAIDKRLRITLTPRSDKQIEIVSQNSKQSIITSGVNILEMTKKAQAQWKRFLLTNEITFLTSMTSELLSYPLIAIGETLLFYKKRLPSGFTITIDSAIPLGSGLGSSAALSVTIAAAVSLFLGEKIDTQKIYDIALVTEQKKHGRPSGGDPAVVLHGGLVWFRRETQNLKIIEPVPFSISEKIAHHFSMIDTGKPEESTGEMIATVKQFMDTDPSANDVFDDQERLTREMLDAIKNEDEKGIINIIKQGQRNLEKMGVVSIFVKKLIREIEKSGGAAKISGGGGKKKGAGMLLVYHPNSKRLDTIVQSSTLQAHKIYLGGEGLIIE